MTATRTQLAERLGIHPRTLTRDSERDAAFPVPLRVGINKLLYVISEVLDYYRKRTPST